MLLPVDCLSDLTANRCRDTTLTTIANSLGILSVLVIIIYQFVDVSQRRQTNVDAAGIGHAG